MRGMAWERSPGRPVVEGLERRLLLTGSYDVGASLISPEWFERLPASLPEAEGSLAESPERGVGHMLWQGRAVEVSRGEWIVQLTNDAINRVGSVAGAAAIFGGSPLDIEIVRGLGMAGQLLLRAPGADVGAVVHWLGSSDSVAYFEPNAIRTIEELPDDPRFSDQWNMHDLLWDADIDAPDAWDVYTGSGDVVVAVIDTGVDYAHPDLDGNIWVNPGEIPGNGIDDDGNGRVDDVHGWDFGDGDGDPMDHHSHGTHVAGIIGAEGGNGVGVAGVNWSASIMALKYTDDGGGGFADDSVAAINYATMMRRDYGINVRVINASYGEYTFIHSERDAIQAAGEAGILFVAAAGERDPHPVDNDLMPHYPSCYPLDNIIAVAATDGLGSLASYSDWGASSIDLAAPGGDWIEVLSTVPGGGYGEKIGTSMATPHVAGVAALAWSIAPAAGCEQIRAAILDGVAPEASLQGKTVTGGRLDAFGALEALRPRIQGTSWDDLDGDGSRDLGEPGLPGRTVYLDLNGNGMFDSAGETVEIDSTDVPKSIADVWYVTTTSESVVSGVGGNVVDVDVTLGISHYRDSDLDVHLVSPSGTKVELFTDVGGLGEHFSNTTLDDEASLSIVLGVPPFAGSYQPEGSLADFDGENPNGTWTLEIRDDTFGSTGTLDNWSITVTTTEGAEPNIQTDRNGRYAFAWLAPGTYTVREVVKPGWQQTAPASGYHEVNVASGQAVGGVDFGNRLPQTEIRGRKWNDLDGDGVWEDGEPGLPEWTIYLDLNENGVWDGSGSSGPTTVASTDVPISIPDPGTVTSDLSVSGAAGALADLDVTLDITHGWDSDLDVYLLSPLGTRVELFTGVGGMEENFSGTTLDDEATLAIGSGFAPFSGRYRPEGSLAALDGEDPNGTWRLEITDTEDLIAGALNSWSITFTVSGAEPHRQTDAEGLYVFGDLDPGTYTVREVVKPGWQQTAPASGYHEVSVASGQAVEGVDFGNRLPRTEIRGRKWNDLDGDGVWEDGEPGLPEWTIYLDLNGNGVWDGSGGSGPTTVASTDVPIAILDLDTVTSDLSVGGAAGALTDLDVTLDITHNWDSDLDVYLISPLGTRVELFTGVGGMGEDFSGTTLDDEATLAIGSGFAPFSGRYRPEGSLAALDGEDPNGTWLLEITDTEEYLAGTLNSWSITFRVEAGEPYRQTDAEGMYVFDDLDPGTYTVREVGESGWEQTCPAAGFREVTVVAGQVVEGVDFGNCRAVAARHVFYNNSVLDGENALAGADDDDAIDTGKQALRPGQTATSAHLTRYGRGINGIMVDMDIEGLAGPPGAGDFVFKVGTSDDPGSWADAPAPANDITADIRLGAGVGGADRITIIWSDGGIAGCWLQVTVLPTDHTGLPEEDVFYFGSLPGDANCDSAVDHLDYLAIKRTFGAGGDPGGASCDFDVDGDVDYDDYVVMRGSFGESIGPMPAFPAAAPLARDDQPASAPAAVPEAGAAAIAGTADAVRSWPSGDGSAGGDFRFRLNALPGDAECSGEVRSRDAVKVRRKSNTELPPGEPVVPPASPLGAPADAALIAAALRAAEREADSDALAPILPDVLSLAEVLPLGV